MGMVWLLDIAYNDNTEKKIDMANYKAIVVRVNYNNFVQHAIYPKGLLSTTQTKVITIEPDRGYYCIAKITSSYVDESNSATIRLAGIVKHLDTVMTVINVYGLK